MADMPTPHGDGAPSRRVAAVLRAGIEGGQFLPGDQLPSERDLAATHGVARNTAREAVRLLTDAGLVRAEHGRGVFVCAKPPPLVDDCVYTTAELDSLPSMSVVQFRGPGLGACTRLVWQRDGAEWFSPGSAEASASSYFPPEVFPAVVLWRPVPSAQDEPTCRE